MTYYRHRDAEKLGICEYQIWDSVKKRMINCGKPAVGTRGAGRKGQCLCEDHFDYCFKMEKNSRLRNV